MEPNHIQYWQVLLVTLLRYTTVAGGTYLLFYVWKKRSWLHLKIQPHFPKGKIVRSEIRYSMSTLLIFAAVLYGTFFSPFRGFTQIYSEVSEYSVFYLIISFPLVILFHDTYFYWMHRFMHIKAVFPYVHHIHHRSHNPTPLAAFSFHPLEAIIEVGVVPLMVCVLPVHRLVVLFFGLYMLLTNVMGHLGYELFPSVLTRHPFFKFLNSSTHHNMHHHYSKANYGLYLNLWDRLMGTQHHQYDKEFEQVTTRRQQGKPSQQAV